MLGPDNGGLDNGSTVSGLLGWGVSQGVLEGSSSVEARAIGLVAEQNQRPASASAKWSQQTVDLIAAFNTEFRDVEMIRGGLCVGGDGGEV